MYSLFRGGIFPKFKPKSDGDDKSSSIDIILGTDDDDNPHYETAFISGFCAGVADTFINYIPYGLHIRRQRLEPINPFKNPSIYHYKEIYRGVGAYAVIIPITCICDGLSQLLIRRYDVPSFYATFAAGMVGAFIVSAPTTNTIVIQQKYKLAPLQAIKHIRATNGILHLYTGMSMFLMREGIYSNAVFYAKPKVQRELFSNSLVASVTVGLVAAILSQPFDTVATYMTNTEKKKIKVLEAIKMMYNETNKENGGKKMGFKRFYLGFTLRSYCVIMGVVVMDFVSNMVKELINKKRTNV